MIVTTAQNTRNPDCQIRLTRIEIKKKIGFQPLLFNKGITSVNFRFGNWTVVDQNNQSLDLPESNIKNSQSTLFARGDEGSVAISISLPVQAFHVATGLNAFKEQKNIYDLRNLIAENKILDIRKQIEKNENIEQIMEILSDTLNGVICSWSKKIKSSRITDYIQEKKGVLSKHDLVGNFQIRERSLERLFNKEVGSSPHQYIKMIRFLNFFHEYRIDDEIISKYDYFDRSHVEKDFAQYLKFKVNDYCEIKYPFSSIII